jgi:gelsolin
MAVLVKPKKYDWKDSNLALLGSDIERRIKNESAGTEPAWQNAGKVVGLQIWRIVNFKVTDWPRELYGQFFNGDSYIVMNTYKPRPTSNDLAYDIHFWIGNNSTPDEYGTAAYKTVELDTYLDDKPIQHREVEGYESDLFMSYFPKGLVLLEGGADSGFHHVEPKQYKPRLFHFHGQGKNVVVTQVQASKSRLDSGDVFILDMGLKVYQWNGSGASVFERQKAMKFMQDLRSERSGKAVVAEVVDESCTGMDSTDDHPFYEALTETDSTEGDYHVSVVNSEPQLFRVSDASGSTKFDKMKEGAVKKNDFDSDDVFILDTCKSCFVWVGKGSTPDEKKNGFVYAHSHLMKTANPLRPIVVIKEGQDNKDFQMALAA